MQIGIFLPNWIGDTVMATPTLRALRAHFGPEARMIGISRPHLADVLAGTAWLDEQIPFDPRSRDCAMRGWEVSRQLRARRLDAIVLLSNSFRTALIAWASRAPQRVGYARHGRGLLLTDRVYAPREDGHLLPIPTIDAYLQLAYAMGCPVESPRMELATNAADEEAADRIWRKWRLPAGEEVVVINSGGAFGAAKHWPAEYFGELARRIATRDGLAVLVNCGPGERKIAAEIVRIAHHPAVVGLAEEEHLPIGLTKACIRRSRLTVSTDSGPRFFAVAFGVPVVSLFGPTPVELSRTHFAGEVCLARDVPCGPCMQRNCPLGHHQCMRDLSVDQVYQTVAQQLQLASRPAA